MFSVKYIIHLTSVNLILSREIDSHNPPRYTSLWIYRSFSPAISRHRQQSATINITRVDTLNGTEYPILLGWDVLSDILPTYIQLIWVFSPVYKRVNGVGNICNIVAVTEPYCQHYPWFIGISSRLISSYATQRLLYIVCSVVCSLLLPPPLPRKISRNFDVWKLSGSKHFPFKWLLSLFLSLK